MSHLDALNVATRQYITVSRLSTRYKWSDCVRDIRFSDFRPAEDSTMVIGRVWAITGDEHYFFYVDVVLYREDIELVIGPTPVMDVYRLIENKLRNATDQLYNMVENDCFDAWVRKVRMDHEASAHSSEL